MRTALYIRVSTEEQAKHGISLEAQKAALLHYAEEHGLDVIGVYEDDGVSARASYRKREAFSRLLEDVKHDRVDLILFIKLDRWFRDVAGYYEIQKILDEHGVQWNAINEGYDTTSANGRLHLNIKLSIAQDEVERTSERVKFVLERKRERGEYVGGTPLGYTKRESKLHVNPETYPALMEAFDTFIDTRSLSRTQTMLREKYGISMSAPGLRGLLKNKHYVELGAVDEKMLQLVNEIFLSRSQRNSHQTTYMFSGMVYCADCGKRMFATYNGNGTRQYRCTTKRNYGTCSRNGVAETILEKEILMSLPEEVHEENIRVIDEEKNAPDEASIRRKMEKLKDLYMDDLISRDIYKADYEALQKQLSALSSSRRVIDEGELESVMSLYQTFSQEEKRAFWSRILRRVYVLPRGRAEYRVDRLLVL